MSASKQCISRLHKVIMTAARVAIGNYCCRKNISQILGKCGWLDIESMITYASVNLIHKYTKTLTPKSITHKFQNLNTKRTVAKLNTQYTPKTKQFRKFYIF